MTGRTTLSTARPRVTRFRRKRIVSKSADPLGADADRNSQKEDQGDEAILKPDLMRYGSDYTINELPLGSERFEVPHNKMMEGGKPKVNVSLYDLHEHIYREIL